MDANWALSCFSHGLDPFAVAANWVLYYSCLGFAEEETKKK